LRDSWEDRTEWKSVDIYTLLGEAYDDIVHITMLGETEPEKIPKVHGRTFSKAIEHWLSSLYVMLKNPLHTLTFSMSTRLGLTKMARENLVLYEELVKRTEELISRRENDKKEVINLVDLMHDWNKSCEKGGDKSLKFDMIFQPLDHTFFLSKKKLGKD